MSVLNEEEVALYAILNGQKEALKHLQIREEHMQTYLSKFLARNEPAPFFKKIRQLMLQVQSYMKPEEVSQHYLISEQILKLISVRNEEEEQQESQGILDILTSKKKKEGEYENIELSLSFKRVKNDGNTSQYEEEDYQQADQQQIIFNNEDSNEINEKKRSKRTKLVVDNKMLEYLKMVQDEILKVKDVADRYKVSAACIYQIMRTHGFTAPNKGRGRKSTSEIEQQYMQAMNQGGQQTLPKPPLSENEIYEASKMQQQNQNYQQNMQNIQTLNPNQVTLNPTHSTLNQTSQLLQSQSQSNLSSSIQMSQLSQSIMNQGTLTQPSVAQIPSLNQYMQNSNLGAQMMPNLQNSQQQMMSYLDGNLNLIVDPNMMMQEQVKGDDDCKDQNEEDNNNQYEDTGNREEDNQEEDSESKGDEEEDDDEDD